MSNKIIKRPEIVTDEHLSYLDSLRISGVTNMWGADLYIKQRYSISKADANIIFIYWKQSISERKEIKSLIDIPNKFNYE